MAISGTGRRRIEITVNGKPAGEVQLSFPEATFGARIGIQGIWYERELAFDTSMLNKGKNTMTLTVQAGSVSDGVMYDYIRLELDENTQ